MSIIRFYLPSARTWPARSEESSAPSSPRPPAEIPQIALHERMVRDRVDPGLLVSTDFEQQLQASGLFPKVGQPADAEFRFTIKTAGLSIPSGFATRLDPTMHVEATLVRRDGKEIWYDAATVCGEDPNSAYVGHPLDEYFSQPNLLRDSFAKAAHVAASMMMQDLKDDIRR